MGAIKQAQKSVRDNSTTIIKEILREHVDGLTVELKGDVNDGIDNVSEISLIELT